MILAAGARNFTVPLSSTIRPMSTCLFLSFRFDNEPAAGEAAKLDRLLRSAPKLKKAPLAAVEAAPASKARRREINCLSMVPSVIFGQGWRNSAYGCGSGIRWCARQPTGRRQFKRGKRRMAL